MIKFFRQIRKQLLEEGKTGKYFKYAIGEILLVVIGILIALSINNWNEGKKRTSQEVKILKEIKSELEDALIVNKSWLGPSSWCGSMMTSKCCDMVWET